MPAEDPAGKVPVRPGMGYDSQVTAGCKPIVTNLNERCGICSHCRNFWGMSKNAEERTVLSHGAWPCCTVRFVQAPGTIDRGEAKVLSGI